MVETDSGDWRLVTHREIGQMDKHSKDNGGQVSHCQRRESPI